MNTAQFTYMELTVICLALMHRGEAIDQMLHNAPNDRRYRKLLADSKENSELLSKVIDLCES